MSVVSGAALLDSAVDYLLESMVKNVFNSKRDQREKSLLRNKREKTENTLNGQTETHQFSNEKVAKQRGIMGEQPASLMRFYLM